MNYPTLLFLRTRIRTELELLNEPGITDAEINQSINNGIRAAVAEIHTLYEDYFLTNAYLSLTSGQSDVTLPADLYADKIRSIIYQNGSVVYEIKPLRGKGLFEKIKRAQVFNQFLPYWYVLVNTAGAKPVLRLVPGSQETSTTNVTCWYLREAAALSSDTDTCDIPEFSEFVVAFAKDEVAKNKPGLVVDPSVHEKKLEALFTQMTATLQNRVPDSNDEVYMDDEFYQEHS